MKKQSISENDPQLIRAILENILIAIKRIERRFAGVDHPDDFLSSDEGVDRLDGIAMMLITTQNKIPALKQAIYDLKTRY